MRVLSDPQVADAIVALVVAGIGALAGICALIVKQIRSYMEAKFAHVLANVEDARVAAQSADAEVRNSHGTNIRHDIDEAIAGVNAVADRLGGVTSQLEVLTGKVEAANAALADHGSSLLAAHERLSRIDERSARMAEELHDERTARESAQRVIDEHAHDAHTRLHERLDKLQEKVEKWGQL
jgi:hypothetical protein|nr:MAG TPA: Protein of unknown function (DUF2746) [Caudoviricetes sp.]